MFCEFTFTPHLFLHVLLYINLNRLPTLRKIFFKKIS